jgi:hypothetical protein
MTTQIYKLGVIVEKNSNRIEIKRDDVEILMNFLLNSNFISNINISYVEIDFNADSLQDICNKLESKHDTNVWITCLQGYKVKKVISAYFYNIIFKSKILISVCDELDETIINQNVMHVNSTQKSIMGAIITLFKTKIIDVYDYLYVFYDNNHMSNYYLFQKYWTSLNTNIIIKYINIDNFIEKSNAIFAIKNDINSKILSSYNTAFLYLSDTLEIFFEIYSIVEDNSLINTSQFINNIRHYNYYDAYINTDYITILEYMKKYLSPKFILTNGNYDEFFYNNLRCSIITQSITPSQNEKLNYLKYIYYIKSDVSSDYLKKNRISIYTIFMEKALIIAKEILYRNINNITLYNNSLYLEGRIYGNLLSELTGNKNDANFFMRNTFITNPIENLYDIYNKINKLEKIKDIISTVSFNME